LGGLGAMYAVHFRLIGKRIVNLPISDNQTLFTRYYGSGATSEYRIKIGISAGTRPAWPKI